MARNKSNIDGGWGWWICLGGFINIFCAAGFFNCGGVVLSAMVDHFQIKRIEAATITSLPASCVYLFAPLSTFICSRFGARTNIFLGALVSVFAATSSSLASNINYLYFTYGVCGGLGSSLLLYPNFIILSRYFKKRIALANSIVWSGSSIGTFILSPVLQKLFIALGLNNGLLVMASFFTVLLIPFLLFNAKKSPTDDHHTEQRKWLSLHVFKNSNYIAWMVVVFFYQIQHMVPYVHLVRFAEDVGTDKVTASFLISIIAGSSLAGRLFAGFIADLTCCNKLHVLQVGFLCAAVFTALVHLARSFALIAFFAGVFGFSEGIYVMLFIVIIREVVGVQDMSFALGVAYGILAIPKTLGPILAGFLFDQTKTYTLAFMVGSGFIFLSSMLISAIDLSKTNNNEDKILCEEDQKEIDEKVCRETTL